MAFKWTTTLPEPGHKIKSQDFEVSNRVYRLVISRVHAAQKPKNDKIKTQKYVKYFMAIEYRGNSYTQIPVAMTIRIHPDEESLEIDESRTLTYSFCKYDEWYGEYFHIHQKYIKKCSVTLSIEPLNQIITGIHNLGATCYMNSIIQMMYWDKDIINRIMSFDKLFEEFPTDMNGNVSSCSQNGEEKYKNLKTLQKLFYLLHTTKVIEEKDNNTAQFNRSTNSASMFTPPAFNPSPHLNFTLLGPINEHQDVHEWFKMLMDRIENEIKEYLKEFGDQNESETQNESISEDLKKGKVSEKNEEEEQDCDSGIESDEEADTRKTQVKRTESTSEKGANEITKDLLNDLFTGTMVHRIDADCGCTSERKETFSELELFLVDCDESCELLKNSCNDLEVEKSEKNIEKTTEKKPERSNLDHLLTHFFALDILNGSNQYKCENCNIFTDAVKYARIKTLPKKLMIVIKRFGVYIDENDNIAVNKSHKAVKYNEKIDLTKFISKSKNDENLEQQNNLNLKTVIIHQGTPNDGHYYCYSSVPTLNSDSDRNFYYKFNDSIVTPASSFEVLHHQSGGKHPYRGDEMDHSAYVLIYNTADDENAAEKLNENF